MAIFGNILTENSLIEYDVIEKIIKRSIVKPRYRITVLNPDETADYIIPDEDISSDGINYSEEYQNGQRKSISLTLLNYSGKYTPTMTKIWLSTKFKFEIGLEYKNEIIWFPRGIYILGDITLNEDGSDRTVNLQLKDKYAIFEGKMGTLEDAYEVTLDSDIEDAITGILNFTTGSGYIFDYKKPIFDPSFAGVKTQSSIRIDEGGNLGEVIDALATQLSAEYYYNNVGNLCFYPINETVDDSNKPIIWTFENLNRELHNLSLSYQNEEVVNVIKVVGDNVDNGVYSAVVTNENPRSPICIQRIGRRAAPTYTESNIWSDDLAKDMANYYLRQYSFVSVDFSCNVAFNPLLQINNIVEVENNFLDMEREKLLITSISFTSGDGLMSLKLCNTMDLPSNTRR